MRCKTCETQPLMGGCLRSKCQNCQDVRVDRNIKLCTGCSKSLGQCQRCRKPVKADDAGKPAPDNQSGLLRRGKSALAPKAAGTKKGKSETGGCKTCSVCSATPLPANAAAGSCANCSGFTSSRAIKLCDGCSDKLDRCNRCQRPIGAGKPGGKRRLRSPRPRK